MSGPRKSATGIAGFDEITGGGLPTGRPTLVTGPAGSGKTLFALQFLIHGATDLGEPGVLVTFEESVADLATNVETLGLDLDRLVRDGLVAVDAVRLDPSVIVMTGAWDLSGLLIRLEAAVTKVGAKRVIIDTAEVLFGALPDPATVRAELGGLLRWLRDRHLTAVITGERGRTVDQLTRYGIEEYISDCVIVLDHRVSEQVSTRRLRVVKYRGSVHGTNEYPFLISEEGLTVAPITSLSLEYEASDERVSTGVPELDSMLGGGVFRGSAVMLSGTAGTGKTTLAASAANAACAAGERALFVSLEESPKQLIRNMASVGMDLQKWVDAGTLRIVSMRPTAFGVEEHLAMLAQLIDEFSPSLVVLDAIASLERGGEEAGAGSAIARDIDLIKSRGITAVLTIVTRDQGTESTDVYVSSLVDTWMLVRNHEANGERNRLLFVIKSRGTAHSNQVREFILSDHGPQLVEAYVGPEGVITGSARVAQMERDDRLGQARTDEADRVAAFTVARRAELEAQIAALQARLAAEAAESVRLAHAIAAGDVASETARASGAARRSGPIR